MRVLCAALLCCSLVAASARADELSDPRPPSGLGGIIVGWGGLGVAAGNAATLPLCYSTYNADWQDACVAIHAAFIVGGVAASIPGLLIGYRRRAAYRAWQERQLARVRFHNVDLGLTGNRATLGLRFSF
jgi:hypothetical protein